jgi:protein-S-isoprenylcysteine O-methyltransferase Ste14
MPGVSSGYISGTSVPPRASTAVRCEMYLRALIAFLALPGVVAGLVPALLAYLDAGRIGGSAFGFVLLGIGFLLLLWCVRDFFVAGRGTLAPWDPPKHLVVVGLYRFVRNPMYIAVVTIVIGWSVASGSRLQIWYGVLLAFGFHLRVIYHEEPWLSRQFGDEWADYATSVARWLPRLRPWSCDERT